MIREVGSFEAKTRLAELLRMAQKGDEIVVMRRGERVRWYMMSIGNEVDLHTPHWHGQTVLSMGSRMDMVELLPGSMKTVDMTPDNPGTWLLHCHVNDHITAGMMALFTVTE